MGGVGCCTRINNKSKARLPLLRKDTWVGWDWRDPGLGTSALHRSAALQGAGSIRVAAATGGRAFPFGGAAPWPVRGDGRPALACRGRWRGRAGPGSSRVQWHGRAWVPGPRSSARVTRPVTRARSFLFLFLRGPAFLPSAHLPPRRSRRRRQPRRHVGPRRVPSPGRRRPDAAQARRSSLGPGAAAAER